MSNSIQFVLGFILGLIGWTFGIWISDGNYQTIMGWVGAYWYAVWIARSVYVR